MGTLPRTRTLTSESAVYFKFPSQGRIEGELAWLVPDGMDPKWARENLIKPMAASLANKTLSSVEVLAAWAAVASQVPDPQILPDAVLERALMVAILVARPNLRGS